MNFASIVVLAAVLIAFVLAVRYSIRHGGCSGNCSSCSSCGSCRRQPRSGKKQ